MVELYWQACRLRMNGLRSRHGCSTVDFLARDRTELFRQRFAFFALANYESVVFAMGGPRAARHFAEIYKLPIGYVRFLQAEVIAHSRRNIESCALVQIRLWAFIAKHVLPVISAEWSSVFP